MVAVVDPDPSWPQQYAQLAELVRSALGLRVLTLDHVGSTSVPGLAAKPVIDIVLVVADPDAEDAYVPPLEAAGFVHWIREPWFEGHRMLRHTDPAANLHVFGPDSPAPFRDRVFRDWLRACDEDRDRYATVKREASAAAVAAGEHGMQYNARKEAVIREIHHRAFVAAGLLPS
ncbi:GrpB family protein [Phycicoccus sp. CMS6Z-2]|uniref:GrpB family protein n=2 Tax=Phycicoccus flavus TaxID=2502783 RepID=A0A8T6R403_9MICO|nr:GrpB family protein [Phycicoccus flavus]